MVVRGQSVARRFADIKIFLVINVVCILQKECILLLHPGETLLDMWHKPVFAPVEYI